MASGLEESVQLLLRSGWFSGLLSSSASPSMFWVVVASAINWLDSFSIGAISLNTDSRNLRRWCSWLVLDWNKVSYLFCSWGIQNEREHAMMQSPCSYLFCLLIDTWLFLCIHVENIGFEICLWSRWLRSFLSWLWTMDWTHANEWWLIRSFPLKRHKFLVAYQGLLSKFWVRNGKIHFQGHSHACIW